MGVSPQLGEEMEGGDGAGGAIQAFDILFVSQTGGEQPEGRKRELFWEMQKLGMLSHDWTEPCVRQHSKKGRERLCGVFFPSKKQNQNPKKSNPTRM